MKRVLLSLLLFTCLIAPFATTLLCLKIHKLHIQSSIQHHVERDLIKESLVKLTFLKSDLQHQVKWEGDDEFRFNGEMYDVITSEAMNDSINFLCFLDQKEDGFSQQFGQLLDQSTDDDTWDNENHTRLLKFLESLYYSESTYSLPFYELGDRQLNSDRHFCYSSIVGRQPFPPPRLG